MERELHVQCCKKEYIITDDYDFSSLSESLQNKYSNIIKTEEIHFVRMQNEDEWWTKKCISPELNRKVNVIFHGNENNNFFGHELLHIYTETMVDSSSIMRSMDVTLLNYPQYQNLFNYDCKSQILNNFEHILFFPIYVSLGLDRAQFTLDNKDEVSEMSQIAIELGENGLRDGNSLYKYFGCAFSFMLYHEKEAFYIERQSLMEADESLYSIFLQLRESIYNIDLDRGTPTQEALVIFNTFIISLCTWLNANVIHK